MSDLNEDPNKARTQSDHNAATPPTAVETSYAPESSVETPESKKSASDTQKETLDAIKKGERIALIIAAIVAFGTIGQWITSCNNNASTSRQTERLLDAANRVDDASESFSRSASGINGGVSDAVAKLQDQADKMDKARTSAENNSTNSLNATINQFHQDQRAWVGPSEVSPFSFTPSPNFSIELKVTNSGKTPALHTGNRIVLRSQPSSEKFSPVITEPDSATVDSDSTILPGGTLTIRTRDVSISQSQIDIVKSGKFILYVYGFIAYEDIFKKTHLTRFCKFVVDSNRLEDCDSYNYAD